jgi:hypothetical protein
MKIENDFFGVVELAKAIKEIVIGLLYLIPFILGCWFILLVLRFIYRFITQ